MQALLNQYWQGLEYLIARGRPLECVHLSNLIGSEMLAVEPDVRNQEIGSCLSERSCQFLVQKAIGYLRQVGYMPAHRRDGALRHHSEQVVANIFDLVMV